MAKRLALAEDAKTKAEAALKELQMKYDHYKKEQDAIKSGIIINISNDL